MAVGGWIYGHTKLNAAAQTDTNGLIELQQIVTMLEGFSGWSVTTSAVKYNGTTTSTAFYAELSHTDGQAISVVYTLKGLGVFIHATNWYDGVSESGSSGYARSLFIAYCPSGHSGFTGTPNLSGYLPTEAVKFVNLTGGTLIAGSVTQWHYTSHIHAMVRGSDITIAIERDSNLSRRIDYLFLAGDIFETLTHSTDTNVLGTVTWGGVLDLSSTSRIAQYYKANGDRLWGTQTAGPGDVDTYIRANTTLLNMNVSGRDAWVQATLNMDSADLTTYGIVPGNGMKGTLHQEGFRVTNSGWHRPKERLDGQNFIHLNGGFVVGWDPSNGPMN